MSIGLVYDLRSEYLAEGYTEEQVAEFDSDETIDAIENTIRALGYRVVRIGNARKLCAWLVAGERWDLVFTVAEGMRGRSRESQVPAILELYGVPYTFSDPLTCAATLDKAVAKRLVREAGLNTPDFRVVRSAGDLARVDLAFPLFVKPIAEGTGKGIDNDSRIESREQLERVCTALLARSSQPVLVEKYLPGREFTTAVLGADGKARVLGTMEIEILPRDANAIYSYETKERCETQVRYSPLREIDLRREVEALALACYRTLECRDAGRVDIRLDAEGRPAFIEINPLAGLHPSHSDLPMIAAQEGMRYDRLIDNVIRSALERARIAVPESGNETQSSPSTDTLQLA
ncbi:D-alanine--D-alanine ligase [Candidatus Sumerlaeota bacterium]|nr:D-alanine--D-alanine ligase [Candidatus Sumerlaeota bacterium]